MLKKTGLLILGRIAVFFTLILFAPLAGAKTNPPVGADFQWDSPQYYVVLFLPG